MKTVYEAKGPNGQRITVRFSGEPSDAAWRRFGDVALRILENLADRDARAAAARLDDAD